MTEAEERERLRYLQLKAKAAAGPRPDATGPGVHSGPGYSYNEAQKRMPASEAAALGAMGGITADFDDEAFGAVAKAAIRDPVRLGSAAQPAPDDTPEIRQLKLRMLAEQDAQPTVYERGRDLIRKAKEQAKQEQPGIYGASKVAGGLAATMLPIVGSSQVGTLGRSILSGAAYGAADGLGDSRAKLNRNVTGGDVAAAVADMAGGAIQGAAGATLGFGVGKALPLGLRGAQRVNEAIAERTGRRALLSGADSLSGRAEIPKEAILEAIRSHGILPLGTAKGAAKRLGEKVDELDVIRRTIIERLERAGVEGAEADDVVEAMLARAADEFANTGSNKAAANVFLREAIEIERLAGGPGGKLRLSQGERVKADLADQARLDRMSRGTKQKALGQASGILREANEKAVERAGRDNPGTEIAEAAESFVPVKQRMSRLIPAKEAAERGATAGSRRGTVGLKDLAFGAATGGGSATGTAGTALLSSILRERLPSTVAATAYWSSRGNKALADLLQRVPHRAALGAKLGSSSERALNRNLSEDEIRALIEALGSR